MNNFLNAVLQSLYVSFIVPWFYYPGRWLSKIALNIRIWSSLIFFFLNKCNNSSFFATKKKTNGFLEFILKQEFVLFPLSTHILN